MSVITLCLCVECPKRFTCDFALSTWAAKARMADKGESISFTTIYCTLRKRGKK